MLLGTQKPRRMFFTVWSLKVLFNVEICYLMKKEAIPAVMLCPTERDHI